MKILLINKFLYPKGGDAISTITTGGLLARRGHEVNFWGMEHPDNPEYPLKEFFVSRVDYDLSKGLSEKLKISMNILYSFEARRKIEQVLNKVKPDIVHLNNFAHQISPSVLDAIKKRGIATLMTMRDYKLVCPSYTMLVDGKLCEQCGNERYYHCALNKCTKNSYSKSFINTLEMYLHHSILHIYDKIDLYISPSRFLMDKVKEMKFAGEVVHIPNFVNVGDFKHSYTPAGKNIVYVGRLSHEKGIETLMNAVKGIDAELKIIGDGPLMEQLTGKVKTDRINNIEFLGYKTGEDLHNEIRKSMFVVIPSEWYENNPRTVIEAFALGKPVIGARIGGIPELVRDWETGLTFESGNTGDLKEKLCLAIENKEKLQEMGKRARMFVESELGPDKHYDSLMEAYETAMNRGGG